MSAAANAAGFLAVYNRQPQIAERCRLMERELHYVFLGYSPREATDMVREEEEIAA